MDVLPLCITSMMQLDWASMVLGAGFYVFCQLLSGKMAVGFLRRQRETQPLRKDPAVLEDNDIEELGSQTKPEPDAEPELQPAALESATDTRISMLAATCLILAAAVIRIAYFRGAHGNSLDNCPYTLHTAPYTEGHFDSVQSVYDSREEFM
eukprot:CAMPEP_0172900046 /NCGR_PEP_ID=MMETSP1075-20121228/163205_1 /TAXON_ID=2916 /ORGANISM="Ceratium fusus, Strain PA161109" /LENGTH=151 /DNA_ID=CAMNT_0013756153 /DNA_START=110 /DNA_END=562 /DNA_ORIENTATION=+